MILIAISTSLLGVFVLWKKISYYGDALSHSVLLGLICGAIFSIPQLIALVIFAIIFAIIFEFISNNRYFSKDSLIMILSYSFIALASLTRDIWFKNFNFNSYIFGEILTAQNSDILFLSFLAILIIIYVFSAHKKLLLISINQDLAKIEGIKIKLWKSSFLILLSLLIATCVPIIGVFLTTALLILPAAVARIFSSSSTKMIFFSLLSTIIICPFSFLTAANYDLTISSTIIVIYSLTFFGFLALKNLLKND